MKKAKVLLLMSALVTMLCACGSAGKTQLTEADLATMSDAELEALIEEQVANLEAGENAGNQEKVDAQGAGNGEEAVEETFECLPEMLEADLEDCLIQIDKTILRDDQTMSLAEVITALQNSGVEYSFKVDTGGYKSETVDYNADSIVMGNSAIFVEVYKGDAKYFTISAINTSKETVQASDDTVIFNQITAQSDSSYKNTYYCKGIRADGEGQTYESMKVIFAKYADVMTERMQLVENRRNGETMKAITVSFEIPAENVNGETVKINAGYAIDSADSSCISMGVGTYQ